MLALDGYWQKLAKIRILMGNEVTKRTKKALLAGAEILKRALDKSIEHEKETNDFLTGVPAIVDAMGTGQIECRVYNKDKFHAKAYITHSKLSVIPSTALVGSSNFSYPGLTDNVELNVQIRNETLSDIRKKIGKHIRDTYLKKVQAPQGVKATLKAWMELS